MLRVAKPQHRSNERAPITALRCEAFVVEHIGHQLQIEIGDVLSAETPLPWRMRKRVARKGWRDHGEMLSEQGYQLVEFEDRARPTVRNQERNRILRSTRLVNEVQIDPADGNGELTEGIEFRFPRAPVEARTPILNQRLHVGEAGARGPGLLRGLVRPPRARKAFV